jgi:hypothetical protein
MTTNQPEQTQRTVLSTKVVDCAGQLHRVMQRLRAQSQSATTSSQGGNLSAKGRLDAFNESSVKDPAAADLVAHSFDLFGTPLDDAALDTHDTPGHILFNDLHDVDVWPTDEVRASGRTITISFTEDLSDDTQIAGQSIDTEQHGARQGAAFDALNQASNQTLIALWSDFPAYPQPRPHLHRKSHPEDQTATTFDSQFVTLHFAQFTPLFDQVLLDLLALNAGARFPIGDRPLIQSEGKDNGLARTAFGKQLDDRGKQLTLMVQPVKGRPFGLAESVSTEVAAVPLLLLIVNLDVAFAKLPSGRRGFNRARYRLRVHARVLSVALLHRFRQQNSR